ncbi:GNAT family N-acetyltransferase [Clostridium sp.]|uniref:GNAT family N-acetyltransferase n=1 Tax=Clostridium sp. TaxID=1506 RepID=UPI001A3EFBD5|nr:GNAT family N-acetyltransferase [Clostridium sp.]MBK5234871.1 GNAT family N-acetyltransferase [Clostridium sp.]
MFKTISLTLKNINNFREINQFNTKFSLSNKDFFEEYDNSNIIQKIFLRKNVHLLLKKDNCIGYIWFEKQSKYNICINSINAIEDDNLVCYYRTLVNSLTGKRSLTSNSLITYECEDNEVNIIVLNKLGFKRAKGFIELEKECTKYHNNIAPENITFSLVKKNKDEKARCLLQNEIFENDDRVPINIEDIYYDEAQAYYIDKGAIFIRLDNKPIGYGQIIVEDKVATIVNFGIIQKHRKKGYGKVLLRYLLNIAIDNDFSKVSLRVDSNNVAAFKLYLCLGFNIKKEFYTWQIDKL